MSSRTARDQLSPGPLRVSDLDPTSPAVPSSELPTHPRKLEPIVTSSVTPRKKKKKKRKSQRAPNQDGMLTDDSPGDDLMGTSGLNQLRSRLDPMYNPPDPSLALSHTPDHAHQQAPSHRSSEQVDTTAQDTLASLSETALVSEDVAKPRRTKKRRKRQDGSSELRENPDGVTEMTNTGDEVPQYNGEEQGSPHRYSSPIEQDDTAASSHGHSHGRQLPEFPGDGDATIDMPTPPTLADELAGNQETTRFTTSKNPQLLVSEEDITAEPLDEYGGLHTLPSSHHHPSTSLTKEVVFVERKDGHGFVAQRRSKNFADAQDDTGGEGRASVHDISSTEFALYAHRATHRLALTAHGFAAGISLWDCIVSSLLAQQANRHVDLLQYHHPLTLPAQAVYICLLTLVLVALLDRFDFARIEKICLENFIRSPSQIILFIALVLVSAALVVTVSVAAIDERIALYPVQPSLWSDVLVAINTSTSGFSSTPDLPPTTHPVGGDGLVYAPGGDPSSQILTSWLAVVVVRAVCCCLSWLAVTWSNNAHGRLEDYLRSCVLEKATK